MDTRVPRWQEVEESMTTEDHQSRQLAEAGVQKKRIPAPPENHQDHRLVVNSVHEIPEYKIGRECHLKPRHLEN